jgi:hypothetical protein
MANVTKQPRCLIGYNPDRAMTTEQLEHFLEQQVQQEIDNALLLGL